MKMNKIKMMQNVDNEEDDDVEYFFYYLFDEYKAYSYE